MAKARNDGRAAGAISRIPRNHIRPFPGQPREYFDQKALEELAGSLTAIGQVTPVVVRRLPRGEEHAYELIDGQRRWIATGMAGIEYLCAWVKEVQSVEEQFESAVAANFGRADHTPLEIARALKRLLDREGSSVPRVAKICARSDPWVYQHLSLLKLDPSVQERMAPRLSDEKRLTFSVAVQLVPFPPKLQKDILAEITKRGMRLNQARAFIRTTAAEQGFRQTRGRPRKPTDDYRVLKSFVARTLRDLEFLLMQPGQTFDAMLMRRLPGELNDLLGKIKSCREQLKLLGEEVKMNLVRRSAK